MIPEKPIVLEGRDLEEFEDYRNRRPSQDELDYANAAEEYFKQNPPRK